ncbi:MAG: alpha/beta fold hydrolase [Candidatus Uhrbacteria bacterium]|nr:alpha/beta fold hydrolase [Candidatus Uhrbacteria bacterium]
MRIVLIHGYKASSQTNFFPWLADELREKGHEVIVLDLPNADAPDPEEWTKVLVEAVRYVDDETIILGHSIGGAEALRFLEAVEARSTPHGVILVSTPWMIGDEKFRGFFLSELDFDVLMWKASKFIVVHSRDDKVIPFDHAEKYADVLHATLVERNEGEGHFQGESYPVLLALVEKLANTEIICDPGEGLEYQFEGIV